MNVFYLPEDIDWSRAVAAFNADEPTWCCGEDRPCNGPCAHCLCNNMLGGYVTQRMELFAALAADRGFMITRNGFKHIGTTKNSANSAKILER